MTLDSVLVVDDNEDVLLSLELLLKQHCSKVVTEPDPSRIPDHLSNGSFDAILLDMNFTRDTTSGREGFHWLDEIVSRKPNSVVVLITGHGDVEMAVRAIKHGATDFVLKPWDNDKLVETLRSALKKRPAAAGDPDATDQIRQELQYAREVQKRLFPQTRPRLQTLEYTGICKTAFDTGGDYYDFLPLSQGKLGLALGDVSGKGVSAALLMASLQGRLQSVAPLRGEVVHELLAEINHSMCRSTGSNRFVTFFYALYDDRRRELTYVNAGHNPPLLLQNGARGFRRLESGGTVLGVLPEAAYASETIRLAAGDVLVMFTDGITEALNGDGEEFGEERLLDLLDRHRGLAPVALQQHILDGIAEFQQGADQRDDMTLVIARVL